MRNSSTSFHQCMLSLLLRFNFCQQTREIAELGIVNCALNRVTRRMSYDQNHFRPCLLSGKFHTPKDVWIIDVTCYASVEDVADAEVQDRLSGIPRVNT